MASYHAPGGQFLETPALLARPLRNENGEPEWTGPPPRMTWMSDASDADARKIRDCSSAG